jgi:hypothetical protein
MEKKITTLGTSEDRQARREFLARCGRFAAVTPPAMTMLLTVAAKPREAYASTILGNGRGGNDQGNDHQGDEQ